MQQGQQKQQGQQQQQQQQQQPWDFAAHDTAAGAAEEADSYAGVPRAHGLCGAQAPRCVGSCAYEALACDLDAVKSSYFSMVEHKVPVVRAGLIPDPAIAHAARVAAIAARAAARNASKVAANLQNRTAVAGAADHTSVHTSATSAAAALGNGGAGEVGRAAIPMDASSASDELARQMSVANCECESYPVKPVHKLPQPGSHEPAKTVREPRRPTPTTTPSSTSNSKAPPRSSSAAPAAARSAPE